jgi:putative acetyltransferase
MLLRAERSDDHEPVADLHRAAFGEHGRMVADLVPDLRALITADEGLSLVAEEDGEVVGHVMVTPAWLDAPARLVRVQVLSPLGVRPDRQRRGVGTALARRGLQILADRGVALVFLEGDPGYYGALGFVAAGPLGFRRPSLRIPEPAFQVAVLPAAAALADPSERTGTLVYPRAFWDHDAVGLRDDQAL